MESTKHFKLIDGTFAPEEAQKILLELINTKINYHKLEDFSNHIRFNNDIVHSKNRVEALTNTAQNIKELIKIAAENKLELKIKSAIAIEFVKI
jgi:hypothetical protein